MAVQARAMRLLVEVLGDERVERMAQLGYLDVESTLFRDRAYRIRPWRRIGVLCRRPDGEWVELNRSWCVHPDEVHAMADEVLALYLALRFDESRTLRKANLHREAA
jgi:lactam utilization protein B